MSKLAYLEDILLTEGGGGILSNSVILSYNESSFADAQDALQQYTLGKPVFVRLDSSVTISISEAVSLSPIGGLARIGFEGCRATSGTVLNQSFIVFQDDVWTTESSSIQGIMYATEQEVKHAIDEVVDERS